MANPVEFLTGHLKDQFSSGSGDSASTEGVYGENTERIAVTILIPRGSVTTM